MKTIIEELDDALETIGRLNSEVTKQKLFADDLYKENQQLKEKILNWETAIRKLFESGEAETDIADAELEDLVDNIL